MMSLKFLCKLCNNIASQQSFKISTASIYIAVSSYCRYSMSLLLNIKLCKTILSNLFVNVMAAVENYGIRR